MTAPPSRGRSRWCSAREDVSLVPARSLDEAVTAARQGRPDLVIADANLGGRTGYELCAAVKSDPGPAGRAGLHPRLQPHPLRRRQGPRGRRRRPPDQAVREPGAHRQGAGDPVAADQHRRDGDLAARRAAGADAADGSPGGQPVGVVAIRVLGLGRAPVAVRRAPPSAARDRTTTTTTASSRSSARRARGARRPACARPPAPRPRPRPGRPPAWAPLRPASPPARPRRVPWASPTSFASASPAPAAGLRPSLIPGARPGGDTGRLPYSPLGTPAAGRLGGAARAGAVAARVACRRRRRPARPRRSAPTAASAPAGRTIMGLPAVAIPGVPVRPTSTPPGQPAPSPGLPGIRSPSTGPVPLQPVPAREVPTGELRPAPAAPLAPAARRVSARPAPGSHSSAKSGGPAGTRPEAGSEAGGHRRPGPRIRGHRQAVARGHRAGGLGGGAGAGRGDHPRARRAPGPDSQVVASSVGRLAGRSLAGGRARHVRRMDTSHGVRGFRCPTPRRPTCPRLTTRPPSSSAGTPSGWTRSTSTPTPPPPRRRSRWSSRRPT